MENKYKIQFASGAVHYYKFDWEVRAIMAYTPDNMLPLVAYKPDGTLFDVKAKPECTYSGNYLDR